MTETNETTTYQKQTDKLAQIIHDFIKEEFNDSIWVEDLKQYSEDVILAIARDNYIYLGGDGPHDEEIEAEGTVPTAPAESESAPLMGLTTEEANEALESFFSGGTP